MIQTIIFIYTLELQKAAHHEFLHPGVRGWMDVDTQCMVYSIYDFCAEFLKHILLK